jgi:hypothetical protein
MQYNKYSEIISENEVLIDKDVKKIKTRIPLELTDFILSFFVFAPSGILFWASTWDLFYYYVYPKNLLVSAIVTLCVGLTIHLISYFFQYKLQAYHDKNFTRNSSDFYPKGYFLRFIYTYLLALGYVTQWRGIWDIYGNFIDQIDPLYCFFISICGLLMNCFVLKRSLYSFTTTVPYILYYDVEFDSFFEKDKSIDLRIEGNVRKINAFLNLTILYIIIF